MSRRGAALAAVLALATLAPALRADLPSDVDRLAARYRAQGADVEVLRARFASSGSSLWLALPTRFLEGNRDACTTVTVLGAVSTVFAVRTVAETAAAGIEREEYPSRAGAVVIRRCGDGRGMLLHVLVQLRSPHGIIETVVASSTRSLEPVTTVLPHRDPGMAPDMVRPGPAPTPPPLAARVEAAVARLSRDPGSTVTRELVPADFHGAATLPVDLAPGCHRFVVASELAPPREVPHDVDAELADASDEVLDSDRTESPDATLIACVGEPRTISLRFAGSAPGQAAALIHAATPLPLYSPPAFGPEARARLARALLERSIPGPMGPARFVSLGVAGGMTLPVEVEPGQCYLAALVSVQGDARLLSLRVMHGITRNAAHSDHGDSAAATTFCAGPETHAHLDIEAHGGLLAWGAALWPLSRAPLGEATP